MSVKPVEPPCNDHILPGPEKVVPNNTGSRDKRARSGAKQPRSRARNIRSGEQHFGKSQKTGHRVTTSRCVLKRSIRKVGLG